MITSMTLDGFGHVVRFLAYYDELNEEYKNKVINIAIPPMDKYVIGNQKLGSRFCVYSLFWIKKILEKHRSPDYLKITEKEHSVVENLVATKVLINDFYDVKAGLMDAFKEYTIRCGLYHGELNMVDSDSPRIKTFKKLVVQKADFHDIFFHINLSPSTMIPKMQATYIPVPIITRKVAVDKTIVKKILGINVDEKFILIHRGAAAYKSVYKMLDELNRAVSNMKTDYRVVVSGLMDNDIFEFNDRLIKAPVFKNGIDLINASEMVISKPGMGILQDCIMLKKPLIFLPSDTAERDLKIDLLEKLLLGNMPAINTITSDALSNAIKQGIDMDSYYKERFGTVPCNGAEIIARSIEILYKANKSEIMDAVAQIRKINPYFSSNIDF